MPSLVRPTVAALALLLGASSACDSTAPTASPTDTLAFTPDATLADAGPTDTAVLQDTASAVDAATTEADAPKPDTIGTADAATTDAPSPPTGPLAGRWAQLQVQSALTEVPFVGETTATTRTLLLLDLVPTGSGYVLTQSVCRVDLDSGTDLVRTVLPEAAVAAMPPVSRGATLSTVNAVVVERLTEVWGAVLGALESDALPTAPTDPRVVDHEGDGKPGMTVRVAGLLDGEVYVVQRGSTTLEGTFDGADRFDGLVTWAQEQAILGADNPLLKTPLPTRVNPDASASWFRTTRVAAGTDCAAIIAEAATLFSR